MREATDADDYERLFKEGLDPWDGCERPGPPFSLDDLPPLNLTHKRRRRFRIEFLYYGPPADTTNGPMTDKEARVFLESKMTELQILKRARFYPPKDFWIQEQ